MKKKVGILTFHRAINYGGALQCYCLYKTLESIGCESFIIDYRPECIEMYRKPFSKYEFKRRKGVVSKILYLFGEIVKAKRKRNNGKRFDTLYEGLNFCKIENTVNGVFNNLDIAIIGSDQVWCPRITNGIDPLFWGDFANDKCRVATYAASMGRINKSLTKFEDEIKLKLENFSYISLREEYAKNYINSLTQKEVVCVCDPTLLAPVSVLNAIAAKPKQLDYVLFYALKEEPGMLEFANYIAKQLGTYVLRVKPNKRYSFALSSEDAVYGVTPQEFCGYLKYAKCVVCKSFHGTIISTIFNKNFYSFKSKEMDRAEAYLKAIGLSDRAVKPNDRPCVVPVDYTLAQIEMKKMKEFSLSYLKQVVSNEKV